MIWFLDYGNFMPEGSGLSLFPSAPLAGHTLVIGERNPVYAFQRIIMKMAAGRNEPLSSAVRCSSRSVTLRFMPAIKVSLVPTAKVVLLVCDPIRWLHSAYGDTLNWWHAWTLVLRTH